MPEPNINLLNISREEFKIGFINAMNRLIWENSSNPIKHYHLIRFPDYENMLSYENINLSTLNMKCTSMYQYWYRINTYNGSDEMIYNYDDIVTQVRDYLNYPEIRTIKLKYLKYSFREIVKLIVDNFNFIVVKFSPHQLNLIE